MADGTYTFKTKTGETRESVTGAAVTTTALVSAVCTDKDLRHSHVVGVNCNGANFSGTKLDRASFLKCDLTNAVFSATTKMNGTDFTGSTLTGATFAGVDWSQANLTNTIGTNAWHGAVGSRQETADTSHL